MLIQSLQNQLTEVIDELYQLKLTPEITQPESSFGDFSTNVAFRIANELHRSPQDIAGELAEKLKSPLLVSAEPAGKGFINLVVADKALTEQALMNISKSLPMTLQDQVVVTEFSDPNPFKELHAGHLYTSVVGEAVSRILETVGAKVHRVNFGGDVGLHVGKAMWGILQQLQGEKPELLKKMAKPERANWLSKAYVKGAAAYEDNTKAKAEIDELNKAIYQIHLDDDHASPLAQIYWTCREWSYEYFDQFYDQIGVEFEKYYPESQTMGPGLEAVKTQLKKGVFEKSDGAVIYNGEKAGLHTRVFITKAGLPTYETKDIGLALLKWQDYKFNKSINITGNDIAAYMQVVIQALSGFEPVIAERTTHITHGLVKLKGGAKMSSRQGNVLSAHTVLQAARTQNKQLNNSSDELISLGAVKYTFLKSQIGGDIVYDPDESVTLTGNSGPYIQYVATRIRSILSKAQDNNANLAQLDKLLPVERRLALKLIAYPEVIELAAKNYAPHLITTYLHQLAQLFNAFYEQERVIGDEREQFRLKLVETIAETLEHGLELLGIQIPAKM